MIASPFLSLRLSRIADDAVLWGAEISAKVIHDNTWGAGQARCTYVYRKLRFGRIDDATRRPGHSTQCVKSAELG